MADFCNQCADELKLAVGDLKNITTSKEYKKGKAAIVICEGCGVIQVDPEGNCISNDCLRKGHK